MMLSGTDLNQAFSFALDESHGTPYNDYGTSKYSSIDSYNDSTSSAHVAPPKRSSSAREAMAPAPSKMHHKEASQKVKHTDIEHVVASMKAAPPPQPSNGNYDNIFTHPSPEQKIQMLSNELTRQRDMLEQQRMSNVGYFEKLMSRRKDLLKFMLFSLILLLAFSIHIHVKHYYKAFFQNHVLTPAKEFGVRLVYPVVVLFILWNLRVFVR
jgi:hypothetical protein